MKNPKQKRKSKEPELTEEQVKKLLLAAGFVFVDKKERAFGKSQDELHKGETIIYSEGSTRGVRVR